ncbi:MAG TPA: hypothetical protein VLA49_06575, partial [Anaerolineales bacterium]|nr:hypothetical protein [Anaerolineales bacterium]
IGELVYIWAGYSLHPAKSRPIIQPESKAIDKEWSFLVIGLMLGSIMFILVSFASIQIVRTKKWFALVYIFPSLFIPLLMALVSVTGYRYRLMVEPLIITLVSYALLEIQPALNKWGLTLNGGEIRRST